MFQRKEWDKIPEELNEQEIINLPNKEFKVMIIKLFNELERRMDEHSEDFNKKKVHKNKIELKKTIKVKNTLECFNSRLDETIEKIRELKDREMELTQSE